jgi:small GTP-binding protein
MTTLGIDDQFQCVQLSDGSIIKLRVMDTAGQEKFNAINESYYKQADCCLLVYDITSMDSFKSIKNYYIKKIKEKCNNGLKVILLGNKTDLKDKRQVSDDNGKDLAEENGYMFMESSCKDNYNVSDAFTALVEMTNNEINKRNNNNSISIDKDDNNNTNSSCC